MENKVKSKGMEKHTKFDPKDWMFMSQRQRVSPLPNVISMEAVSENMKQFMGMELEGGIMFFKGNTANFFPHRASLERLGTHLMKLIRTKPKHYAELVEVQAKYGKALVTFTQHAKEEVGPAIADHQLVEYMKQYGEYYRLVYATYGSIWVLDNYLLKELLRIVSLRVPDPVAAADIVNTMTKQPTAMVATMERKALIELAQQVSGDSGWVELVREEDKERIANTRQLARLIENHVENYFWVTRDYEDPSLSFEDVVQHLAETLRGNIEQVYKELTHGLADAEKQRVAYIKTLKLTPEEEGLFATMRDIAHIKEQRKMYVSQSLYYFDAVLEEIARRTYLSVKQVRFMHGDDVKRALIDGEDLTHELNERYALSLWHIRHGKETEIITGEVAKEYFDLMCSVDEQATEFLGMAVSPGIARGPARIVMDPDEANKKIQKGDVLVTVQVVPSFSTAIMKSAALVCDGGHGITSHPATLAREAGIPCVIQTRFMREVVHDGDIVEVDANKGIARIIERRDA